MRVSINGGRPFCSTSRAARVKSASPHFFALPTASYPTITSAAVDKNSPGPPADTLATSESLLCPF